MTVLPNPSRHRIFLFAPALLLALAAWAGPAGARGNAVSASLRITAPASMARGSVLTVTARGFSGRYNAVSWSSEHGGAACAGPVAGTISTQTVRKEHAFAVKLTNIVGAPGALTVCVYLYANGSHAVVTKGHYLVKSAHVKVS
jgi:hypothetical protein